MAHRLSNYTEVQLDGGSDAPDEYWQATMQPTATPPRGGGPRVRAASSKKRGTKMCRVPGCHTEARTCGHEQRGRYLLRGEPLDEKLRVDCTAELRDFVDKSRERGVRLSDMVLLFEADLSRIDVARSACSTVAAWDFADPRAARGKIEERCSAREKDSIERLAVESGTSPGLDARRSQPAYFVRRCIVGYLAVLTKVRGIAEEDALRLLLKKEIDGSTREELRAVTDWLRDPVYKQPHS